jgi:hypothetical protein
LEEKTLPVVVSGVLCDFLLTHFILRVAAAPIIGRMGFYSVSQLAI